MADGTSTGIDASTMEQYVDEDMDAHSDFFEFYIAPDSSGKMFKCIKNIFHAGHLN